MRRFAKISHRQLKLESLENRIVLTATVAVDWHNESNPLDVNADGYVTPIDALQVINVFNKFEGGGANSEVQQAWREVAPDAPQLISHFLPDIDESGSVTPIDALRVINQLNEPDVTDPPSGQVAVMPDGQGRPQSVVITGNGRTKSIDVSQWKATVEWQDGGVTVWEESDASVTIGIGTPLSVPYVAAKPGVGMLTTMMRDGELEAEVTRFEPNGVISERYTCEPGFIWEEPLVVEIRRPIDGFENIVGAMVAREFDFDDGSVVTQRFEETAKRTPLSITATLATGESLDVDIAASQATPPEDLTAVNDDMLYLLNHGYVADAAITLGELAAAVELERAEE